MFQFFLFFLIKKVKNRTSTGITHTDLVLFLEITGIYHFHILKFDFLKPVRRISRLVEAIFFLLLLFRYRNLLQIIFFLNNLMWVYNKL